MRATTTLLVLALGLSLAGCGVGGDERRIPPPPTAASLFSGEYFTAGWAGAHVPVAAHTCSWGQLTADGVDNWSGSLATNIEGFILAPAPTGALTYTASSDRSIDWLLPDGSTMSGGVSATGDVLGLGSTTTDARPRVYLLSRRATTLAAADLNGAYHVAGFNYDTFTGEHMGVWGTVSFDGTSAGVIDVATNEDGLIGPSIPSALTYALAADGALSLDTGLMSFEGGVLESGELGITAGGTLTGDRPLMLAFVPQSTGATDTLLDGRYFLVGCELDRLGQVWSHRTITGIVQADGAGGVTPTYSQNTEGTIVSTSPIWTGYTVTADGGLTITTSAGETFEGGVSPSGDFAVLGGGTTAANDSVFFFLFR